ncbi:hypothetical protein [Streptosporangium carneum]|uniref:Uncharacterized protein n=1 Tax=Streptosporangium carneum TaxID=47481 RepID=A0A9W6MCC2_9ACTN|nr:hypothetical protein [Streptosporangium carneum]GLK08680.1 hypothetical protein GCM10017600_20850 [Streptosporangium carneum]
MGEADGSLVLAALVAGALALMVGLVVMRHKLGEPGGVKRWLAAERRLSAGRREVGYVVGVDLGWKGVAAQAVDMSAAEVEAWAREESRQAKRVYVSLRDWEGQVTTWVWTDGVRRRTKITRFDYGGG